MDEWVMWAGVKVCTGLAQLGSWQWCSTPADVYNVGVVAWVLVLLLVVAVLVGEGARRTPRR